MSYDDTQEPVLTTDDFPVAPAGNAKIQAQGQLPNGFDLNGFTAPSPSGEPWTQELLAQTAFRFTPLYIPNLTPILNTDGGLNAAALVVNERGVLCILKTWLEQAEFDFIRLEVNDVMVDQHTVSKDEADNGLDIVLFIESSRLIDQANNKIQAFVTNLAGTTDSTKAFNIFVDAQPPVGRDPIVSTPYNENMARVRFADPTIEAFGIITDENAIAGVRMLIEPYPLDKSVPAVHHIKESDVIHLSIGGVIIKHTVSASEATGTSPISIWAYFGTWQAVGAGEFIVEYFVVDRVGNHSPGFSPPRLIQSQIGGNTEPLLPAIFVAESDYDPDEDADFIDLKAFDGDATMEVLIRNYGYVNGDGIQITIRGLSADGVSVETSVDRTVTQPNAIRLEIPLDRAFIEPLVGGRLLINYKRIRAGVPDRQSRNTLLNVQGEPISTTLPPPAVQGLVDGALPVPTNPVRVWVKKYLGQNDDDRVDLVIVGFPTNGSPSYATFIEVAGTGDIEFLLDWTFFASLVGGTFTAHYVINGGTARPPSESTTVQVGAVTATLPPPTTLQAVPPDFTFDPGTHLGNLNARVSPHPAITIDSTVTFYAIGSQPGGSFTSPPFPVTSNWFGVQIPFTVPRVNVTPNLNHSMKLYYIVQPAAPGSTPLPSLPLTVYVGMKLSLTQAPVVVEATVIGTNLARLNPLHTPNVVTIRVKYDAMLASDSVKVHILGKPGVGMPDIAAKPGVAEPGEDYISFTVPSAWIGAYVGDSCEVYFEVTRDHDSIPSVHLTLEVEAFAEQTLDLVSVPEASGGVIDTTNAANVRVNEWPFFKQGQPVFIHLQGTSGHTLRPWTKVSAAEFTAKRTENLIPHSYLQGLDNGSELTIHASVSLDETGMESSAIKLKPVQYQIARKSQVVNYIPVGTYPHYMAITADSKLLFVLNGSTSISVIDTATQKVVKTILTTECHGICTSNDGTKLYVCRYKLGSSGAILTYSTSTLSLLTTNYLTNNYIARAAINPADDKLYLSVLVPPSNYAMTVVGLPNISFIKTINLGSVNDIFTSPEKSFAYLRLASPRILTIVDMNADTASGHTPAFTDLPNKAAFDTLRARLYVTSKNNVEVLNTNSNTISGKLSGFTRAAGIACIPGRNLACVTDTGTNTVTFLDTSTDTLTRLSTLDEFNYPSNAIASPDGKHVYVANEVGHTIAVIKV